MTASVFFPASLINEQLTPEWLRNLEHIERCCICSSRGPLKSGFCEIFEKREGFLVGQAADCARTAILHTTDQNMYALKPRGLLYNQYPYPLNQQGLAAKSSNFNIFFIVSYNN